MVVGIDEKVSIAEGEACYVSQFVRRVSLDAKKEQLHISSCQPKEVIIIKKNQITELIEREFKRTSNTAQGQDY